MIESSRRHGHFDTRWNIDGGRGAIPPTEADSGGASLRRWEDEGGRYTYEGKAEMHASAGLEWLAFLKRNFPRSLRHDLEALKAYETYRSKRASTALDERL